MSFNGPSSFNSNDSGYESGIIEVFDESRHAHQREQKKELARQQQHVLAVELSKQVEEEYQQDILEHMLRVDVSHIKEINTGFGS